MLFCLVTSSCDGKKNSFVQKVPETVVELGPGDSFGVGLAALLSGTKKYYAIDVTPHANLIRNVSILNERVQLFQDRESIPDDTEWPDLFPKLDSYKFPDDIIPKETIEASLLSKRITKIKNSLGNLISSSSDVQIHYYAKWDNAKNYSKQFG